MTKDITHFEEAFDWFAKYQVTDEGHEDEEELVEVAFFGIQYGEIIGLIEEDGSFVDASERDGFIGYERIDPDEVETTCCCDDDTVTGND